MVEPLVAGCEVPRLCTPVDFGNWMMAEQRRIFALCYRFLQDRDEADMATQDSFLKAHQAIQRGTAGVQDYSRWLTRIAVNTCLDRVRSRSWMFWRRRTGPAEEDRILQMRSSQSPGPDQEVFAAQIGKRLTAALDQLSARQRAVFTLRHYEDLRLEEIAGILELDVGTVKAHMARAVAKLRHELKDLYALER
ncbi:MAG: RNA polymerase sigma factor [Acidobacteriia bacterium]|nr:RNA polymerase sigma factor [Terriglobia bacterium]